MDILGSQVLPMIQVLFPNSDAIFEDDDSPMHTARSVQSWSEKHEDALQHLLWLEQSPILTTIKPLWSVLERTVRSRFLSYIISQATRRVIQYSTTDHAKLTRVYCKNDTSYVTGKWWPNSISIKKCVSFTAVSIIFVHLLYT